jgi:hypothetical protein
MLPGLTSNEYKSLILSVGTHRGKRRVSPVEAAVLFDKAQRAGASLVDCAKAMQLSGPTWIGRFLNLLRLPEDVRHLVDWGRGPGAVTFTSATEIARLDEADDKRAAVEAAIAHSLSSSEVRQLVQLRKRSGRTMADCIEGVLKMRPQVEVRHVFIGSVVEALRDRLRSLGQYERDELFAGVVRNAFGGLRPSGRLGVERFTLVGGKEFSGAVAAKEDVLEREINEAIAAGLAGV